MARKLPSQEKNKTDNGHILTNASVLGRICLLVQLQLCFNVLRGEGDADLYASCYPSCNNSQNGSFVAKQNKYQSGFFYQNRTSNPLRFNFNQHNTPIIGDRPFPNRAQLIHNGWLELLTDIGRPQTDQCRHIGNRYRSISKHFGFKDAWNFLLRCCCNLRQKFIVKV